MNYSLNQLYRSIGVSKQSVHQCFDRYYKLKSIEQQLLVLVYQIRTDHPTMCCRDMYFKINPEGIGRDAFELFCKQEGLMSNKPKNYRKTTDSSGVIRFPNYLENLTITYPNQVWQSDITYYEVARRFYYITFITDAFTRRILGYHTSKRLITEHTTLPSLKMAIKTRKEIDLTGLIFHSDGGGQYYDKAFLLLTKRHHIINSMCEHPWENGKAERLNGIIKNNYLVHRKIDTYEELVKEVDRSVYLYNQEKPHIKLQRKTPIQFEKEYICIGQKNESEKSATECNSASEGLFSLSGCGQKNFSSNIAPEYNSIWDQK